MNDEMGQFLPCRSLRGADVPEIVITFLIMQNARTMAWIVLETDLPENRRPLGQTRPEGCDSTSTLP